MRKYLCPTPAHACTGGSSKCGPARLTNQTAHDTPDSAFRCYARYLTSQGYTRLSRREFVNPATGAIRLLDKPSHFGTPIRAGKNDPQSKQSGTKRTTPIRSGSSGAILSG